MSGWDAYINNLCQQKVKKAAIVGVEDHGQIWAKSKDFDLSQNEAADIVDGMKCCDKLRANGVRAAGKKYFCLKAEDTEVQGKQGPEDGIVCFKSNKCALIGVFDKDLTPGEANNVVGKMKDHLQQSGY